MFSFTKHFITQDLKKKKNHNDKLFRVKEVKHNLKFINKLAKK